MAAHDFLAVWAHDPCGLRLELPDWTSAADAYGWKRDERSAQGRVRAQGGEERLDAERARSTERTRTDLRSEAISAEAMSLTDEQLQRLYTWVDEIPLSRPKRNIARDFADGRLVVLTPPPPPISARTRARSLACRCSGSPCMPSVSGRLSSPQHASAVAVAAAGAPPRASMLQGPSAHATATRQHSEQPCP